MELTDLERRLGRRLPSEAGGSIASLNDLPEELIEEARRLDSAPLARMLLGYYVPSDSRSYLKNFIEDVVDGGQPAKSWRRGGVLVPAQSLADQLTEPREVLLGPIGGFAGLRTIPRLESWSAGTSWIGAPARPWPEADYRSSTPSGAALLSSPRLEPAQDEAVTVRRWIAARLARSLGGASPGSVEAMLGPSFPPEPLWSPDARAAAAGLAREHRTMGPPKEEIPGFRGPDSWFSGA